MTFEQPNDSSALPTTATLTIEPHQEIVRLTVTHEGLPDEDSFNAASLGWPAVLAAGGPAPSRPHSPLLETGHILPQAQWEMHAELRAAQMAKNDPR